jgi:hypothetical protein
VTRHHLIRVIGDRVIVSAQDGGLEVYLMDGSGELVLMSSDRSIRASLAAIESKLGS